MGEETTENEIKADGPADQQPDRLGAAGWVGWPALSIKHSLRKSVNSTSLSRKRIRNDTNQPTEQA